MSPFEDLQKRAQRVSARYTAHFAGHPRITRDAELLHRLITELAALVEEVGVLDDVSGELKEGMSRDLTNYRKEHQQIQEDQGGDATAFASARLVGWANLTLSRYRRGFAGRSRSDRDLSRLQRVLVHLTATQEKMTRLLEVRSGDSQLNHVLNLLSERVKTYMREEDAIRQVQATGDTAERGSRYANMANHCLTLYRFHYAGRARVGRSKTLLLAILGELERARTGMEDLAAGGLTDEKHKKNLELVHQNIDAYTNELTHIESAHEAATVAQRVGALGEAANDRFEEYKQHFAGKPRKSCDPDLLDQIVEDLYHTAEQMDQIDHEHGNETNASNLQIVLDRMRMYDREYLAVVQSKGSES
jgi:hypothetical protein